MPTQSPVNTAKTRVGSPFRRLSSLLPGLFFVLSLLFLTVPLTAHAETDTDRELLELYYDPQDLDVSTATRSPRPLSRSAENITIITAEQIEAMNAHTLADVLSTIPGVQVAGNTAPGSAATFEFAGATTRHIQVLIDGVPINTHYNTFPLVGMVPAQNIERIEILKGPGSSAWSSALGGVVSVVTKAPIAGIVPSGSVVASVGENGTRDARGELAGTAGQLGYYLSGGNLQSNGFRTFNATENNNFYTKLRWNLSDKGSLGFTFNYMKTAPEEGYFFDSFYSSIKNRQMLSTLDLDYHLTDRLTLNTKLYAARLDYSNFVTLSTGDQLPVFPIDEKTAGGATVLTWRQGAHTLTGGLDFEHGQTKVEYPTFADGLLKGTNDKWGIFLNDTIAWKRLTLTPAFRYDLTSHAGDFFSPSIGATLSLTDKTLLRAHAARGYNLPEINPGLAVKETGWTVQAGLETTEIPFLWFKGTWFRNEFKERGDTVVRKLREGFEIEARTVPIYNSWLTAGYVFTDAKNLTTDTDIFLIARHTWDLGLHYDDRTFRGALTGHYIWWNAPSELAPGILANAHYKDFIFDLNLGWRFYRKGSIEAELFTTGHNLFDGKQYHMEPFINPSRWFEGGLRIKW